jgi:hypothetical protein
MDHMFDEGSINAAEDGPLDILPLAREPQRDPARPPDWINIPTVSVRPLKT